MTDSAPPPPPATPAPAPEQPAASAAPADAPPKRPGIIRWKLTLFLGGFVAAIVFGGPFVIDPLVARKVGEALTGQNLKLDPGTKIHISLFGGSLRIDNLKLTDAQSGQEAAAATRIEADVALLDSFCARDLILEQVAVEGLSGSLRRRADGTPPGAEKPAPGQEGKPTDWTQWYQKAMEKYKEWSQKKKEEKEAKKEPPKPSEPDQQPPPMDGKHPAQYDPKHPKAVVYLPTKRDGRTKMRILIRQLKISGGKVAMPDEGPFDIASIDVEGKDLAIEQDLGEAMELRAKLATAGAGPATLDLDRTHDDGGHGTIKLQAEKVPLAALTDPKIAGPEFAAYGTSGDAKVDLAGSWKGWDIEGTLTSLITGLRMDPKSGADAQTMQVAQYVNQLKGQAIKWPVKIGGTIEHPKVTDSGVKQVLAGGALEAAKGVVKEKATEEAGKLLEQQGQKNPAVQKAAEGVKDLFKKK